MLEPKNDRSRQRGFPLQQFFSVPKNRIKRGVPVLRFECGTWNSNFEWTLIHGTPNTYVLVHPPFHRFGHQLLHFKLWQDNKCWSQRMIAQDSRLRAYQTFLIFHKDTKNYVGCFCKLVFIRKKIRSISSKKCKCWSTFSGQNSRLELRFSE